MSNLMLLSTHTGVGKHLICCGIIRTLKRHGIAVTPFKAVSINDYTCILDDGSEISFAQTLQAIAAGQKPCVEMNPYVAVYKNNFTLIELGKRLASPPDMIRDRKRYLTVIEDSFRKVAREAQMVIVEGGGSPVELGLEEIDLANIPMAKISQAKILLVTEMIHGGGYASIIGTLSLLPEEIRNSVAGIILNKFDIDEPREFVERGIERLYDLVKIPIMTIPYLKNTFIPDENIFYSIEYYRLNSYDHELNQLADIIEDHIDVNFLKKILDINGGQEDGGFSGSK